MELVFQERKQEYLRRVLRETVSQEQTADIVVPDSIPDADRVVDAFGTLLVRTEICSADSVEISGVVQAGVLFVDEAGEIHKVDTQIPFSIRRELNRQEENCAMICRCNLKSADARLVNSRKLLVRVGIGCTIQVFASLVRTEYDVEEPKENLQLRRTQVPMRMPVCIGERTFSINEELDLPNGKPAVARLLKCLYRTKIQEQRFVGSKAVFKGEVVVHTLYEDGEGKLCTCQWTVPFSQYGEMERELDDCDLQTLLTMTAGETEPDSQMDSRRLLVSVNLLAQCLAVGTQTVSLIEDAYCTDSDLQPRWEEWSMDGILDRQTFRENGVIEAEEAADSVVDAWMYPEDIMRQREGNQMKLTVPMNCNVLFYDAAGNLQGRSLRPSVELTTELAETGECQVTDILNGDIFCAANRDTLAVRIPVDIAVECTADQHFKAVSGAQIEPMEKEAGKRPGVILRRTDKDESVWELAKRFHTPVEAILSANRMENGTIPENTLLLIPM